MTSFQVPEISVKDVAEKMQNGDSFLWIDVRELDEFDLAKYPFDVMKLPLSTIQEKRLDAIPESVQKDKDQEIIISCHHGGRSAQVTGFLLQNGWTNVKNMTGGIHAYSLEVDRHIPTY